MIRLIKKSIYILKNLGPRIFILKLIKFPINRFNLLKQNLAHKKAIKNKEKIIQSLKTFNSNNSEEVFDFVWNFYGGLIRPMQIKEEFVELLKVFQEQNPKYIMEIGTANGGTLFSFCKLAKDDATIISLDLPGGKFGEGGGYPEWKTPIYQSFKKENQKLYLLKEDSHQQETLEKVKQILGGNPLDFLFIDSDHSYEGVKKDFEMYSPLVKKGGIIAFHDIAKHPVDSEFFVDVFWKEIKNNYKNKELIKNFKQKWAGIDVLFLNNG